ncbi:hypothetical protein [uncultured Brevundimonas sp.]|uniref:hypothetical protein n=1 Tax=uncultured Brevundimonas sp. TaxID=213418 RepID=UPI0030EB590E|tara:strand:+ start:2788 stop:3105 length:318 start_codon:yes stop_codon:yes gene_type:complete
MTTQIETAKPGLLNRGKGFLWSLVMLLVVAAVCGWVALGIGLWMDVSRGTRFVLAVVAALSTEALFWTVAAALGVSVLEARKRIWRRITGQDQAATGTVGSDGVV